MSTSVNTCNNLILHAWQSLTRVIRSHAVDLIESSYRQQNRNSGLSFKHFARSADVELSEKVIKWKSKPRKRQNSSVKFLPKVDGNFSRHIWVNVNRFVGSIELSSEPEFPNSIQFINDWKFLRRNFDPSTNICLDFSRFPLTQTNCFESEGVRCCSRLVIKTWHIMKSLCLMLRQLCHSMVMGKSWKVKNVVCLASLDRVVCLCRCKVDGKCSKKGNRQ